MQEISPVDLVLMGFAIWEGVSLQWRAFLLMGKRFGHSGMQVL